MSVDQIKNLLCDPVNRIQLHDYVLAKFQDLLNAMIQEKILDRRVGSGIELKEHLGWYEEATAELRGIMTLMGYWGEACHSRTIPLPATRLAKSIEHKSGLCWYPCLLLLYSGGIAAVTAEMYANLRNMLHAHVQSPSRPGYPTSLALALFDGLSRSNEDFKKILGYERRYAARSEYLFNLLQPELNELLKLGDEYERYFDRFEVLLGLEHAYLNSIRREGNYWGPLGMFAWKFHRMEAESPFHLLLAEAEAQGEDWVPILAGFFGGSFERFKEVSSAYAERIAKLGWH